MCGHEDGQLQRGAGEHVGICSRTARIFLFFIVIILAFVSML